MTDDPDNFTRRLLTDAGLVPGMRVLDVGCGRGDVSVIAAALAGPMGEVVGIDRDGEALTIARERSLTASLAPIQFEQAEIAGAQAFGTFDAVIGRRVLMYQPDAAAALRTLSACLRPGGLVAFQEHDSTCASTVSLPLHDRFRSWLWTTVEREGANIHMGFGLAGALSQAGLAVEHVRAEAIVQTPTQAYRNGEIARSMLPRILRQGVATAEEIDVETIEQRLREERETTGATYVGELVFGAWARKAA